ncbi:MAG: DAK2 domain-containing protein [bacterium]|nr:DAK2 domain-containing protein [bacterium]
MNDVFYVDGNLFRLLLISGAKNLDENRVIVNNLNVFPIPDGDTGDNMCMTIDHGVSEVKDLEEANISVMSKKISRGMLFGARGNSGVILSQIFRGISDGLKDIEKASVADIANAFVSGYEKAYKMVVNPVEGTILTVARIAADKAKSMVTDNMSLKEYFKVLLGYATITLKDTINLLDCLKKANVIDSGGAGFVYILEGMLKCFDTTTNVSDYISSYKFEREKYVSDMSTDLKEYAVITVCNGDGLRELFTNVGCDYIINGGQTMNPSTEDFLRAFDLVNAKNIIVLPNNSNIILAAKQAKELYDKGNVIIINSKTIAEGLSAMSMVNYDDPNFIEEMEEAIKNVTTGEITYAVRDSVVDDVKINKDDFMAIVDKKIVYKANDKYDCLEGLIDYEVNNNYKGIINIIYGADVKEDEINNVCDSLMNKYRNVEINAISGMQDVYSFIVSFE